MWFEFKKIMFSLEVAVPIPLLNSIAYAYIFFCPTSCLDVN